MSLNARFPVYVGQFGTEWFPAKWFWNIAGQYVDEYDGGHWVSPEQIDEIADKMEKEKNDDPDWIRVRDTMVEAAWARCGLEFDF